MYTHTYIYIYIHTRAVDRGSPAERTRLANARRPVCAIVASV